MVGTPQTSSQTLDVCGLAGAGSIEPGLESWQDWVSAKSLREHSKCKEGNEQRCGGRVIQLLGLPESEGWAGPGHPASWVLGAVSCGSPEAGPPGAGKLRRGLTLQPPSPGWGARVSPGTRAGRSHAPLRQDVPTQGLALGKAVGRAWGRAPALWSLCRPFSVTCWADLARCAEQGGE